MEFLMGKRRLLNALKSKKYNMDDRFWHYIAVRSESSKLMERLLVAHLNIKEHRLQEIIKVYISRNSCNARVNDGQIMTDGSSGLMKTVSKPLTVYEGNRINAVRHFISALPLKNGGRKPLVLLTFEDEYSDMEKKIILQAFKKAGTDATYDVILEDNIPPASAS